MTEIVLYIDNNTVNAKSSLGESSLGESSLGESALVDVSAVVCADENIAVSVKQKCFDMGIAVFIENALESCIKHNLDGVYFPENTSVKAVKDIRKSYPDLQIGMDCGVSRHTAMLVGEAGADFVAFNGDTESVTECCRWWQIMIEIPCVAVSQTPIEGADFILKAHV